ncbi:MAG: GTPase Era [Syntrophales bacterium]|nr:GTPase Era [Syntrophales bacterium]
MHKAGFIGIIGKPNVGKSTLLNALVGEKVAIATPKPQTTRHRIMGIRTMEGAQLIFLDTPGIHNPLTPLNKVMVDAARKVLSGVDVLLVLFSAREGIEEEDLVVLDALKKVTVPAFAVLNKTDLVERQHVATLTEEVAALFPFARVLAVSAVKGEGIQELVAALIGHLPVSPPYYDEDMFTDRSERFLAAEMIREKIMLHTHQEVPYGTAVTVDAFQVVQGGKLLRIAATVTVGKESHKGIIIGRGGKMLKQIGREARKDMEAFFGKPVFLEIFVRVRKDWTADERLLRELGYKE